MYITGLLWPVIFAASQGQSSLPDRRMNVVTSDYAMRTASLPTQSLDPSYQMIERHGYKQLIEQYHPHSFLQSHLFDGEVN